MALRVEGGQYRGFVNRGVHSTCRRDASRTRLCFRVSDDLLARSRGSFGIEVWRQRTVLSICLNHCGQAGTPGSILRWSGCTQHERAQQERVQRETTNSRSGRLLHLVEQQCTNGFQIAGYFDDWHILPTSGKLPSRATLIFIGYIGMIHFVPLSFSENCPIEGRFYHARGVLVSKEPPFCNASLCMPWSACALLLRCSIVCHVTHVSPTAPVHRSPRNTSASRPGNCSALGS